MQKREDETNLESEGSQIKTPSQMRSARTAMGLAMENTAGPKEEAKKGKAQGRGKLRKPRQQQ